VFDGDQVGLVSARAVKVTAGVVPVSTVAPALRVVIVEVLLPAAPALVRPLIWIETLMPALIEAEVNE
jgi:hypothetical protein